MLACLQHLQGNALQGDVASSPYLPQPHTHACAAFVLYFHMLELTVACIATSSPACRTCKEVRCKEMWFKDGYGQKLERETICYDPAASLVVTITDTCPCIYPGNYYSNKRWCCGDMYHL
jgi:hypothetical protein